jgi:hypothetical protein
MRLLAASLLLAVTAATPAHAGTDVPCGGSSARTVLENQRARVYVAGNFYYGCHRGRRRVELGQAGGDDDCCSSGGASAATHTLRLKGRLVAFGSESVSHAYGYFLVEVIDLVTRRRVFSVPTSSLDRNSSYGFVFTRGGGPTTDLVLAADGAVAWIVNRIDAPGVVPYEVHRCDRRGCAMLSRNATIEPRSLTLKGGIIRWRQGGAERRARLERAKSRS